MPCTHRFLLLAGLLGLGVITACGGGATDPGHTRGAIPIALNDTISGEITAGETDSFTVRLADSTLVAVYLQVLDTSFAQAEADNHITYATWTGSPGLAANRTTRFMVPAGQRLVVHVGPVPGGDPDFFDGRYRMLVASINPAPETGPATLTLGDSTAEQTLENSADVDTWTLAPAFLDTIGLQPWIELTAPSASGQLKFEIDQPGFTFGIPADSTGFGPARWTFPVRSSLFTAPWRLVIGPTDPPPVNLTNPDLPAYRLGVSLVDFRPEHVPIFPAANDTITGEAADSTGDVDVFLGTLDPTSLGYVAVAQVLGGTPADSLVLQSLSYLGGVTIHGGDTTFGSGALVLSSTVRDGQPGWRMSITGYPSNPGAGPLPYRFAVFRNTGLPEVAPATLVLGDTASEALDFPGDVDVFTVTVDSLPFHLQMETAPTLGSPVFLSVDSSPLVGWGTWVIPPGTAIGDSLITPPIPGPGTYQVRVQSVVNLVGRGPYRVLAH